MSRQLVRLTDIRLGDRARRDLGSLDDLRDSIADVGLLCPIVIDHEHNLICGHRRLEACRLLGWSEIDALTVDYQGDLVKALRAERDENTCRKPFTKSEMVAMAKMIRAYEDKAAAERRKKALQNRNNSSVKITEPENGRARDKVAAALGTNWKTLESAETVVAQGVPELVTAMDEGRLGVAPAAAIAQLPPKEQPAALREKLRQPRKPVTPPTNGTKAEPDMRALYTEGSSMSARVIGQQILLKLDQIGRDDPLAIRQLDMIIDHARAIRDSITRHQETTREHAA
jgi:ParB family chromosome partitioning protein